MRRPTSIAAQGLAPALRILAKERDVQLVYRTELVGDHKTSGAAGDLTFEEALTQLLNGTGLTYRYLENNAITIVPIPSGSTSTFSTSAQREGAGGSGKGEDSAKGSEDNEGAHSKRFWDRFRLAQADQGASSKSSSSEGEEKNPSRTNQNSNTSSVFPIKLQEVVVTAQKRVERLQDVPVPVTALSADALLERNQAQLQDYLQEVPGVTFNNSGDGQNRIVIRGVATGGQVANPTTGVTIDDIPFGASQAYGFGDRLYPDLDPADLARIEVLRGPQGTLYGASSLGGLLKYVTADPSLTALTGYARLDVNGVDHGGTGYGVRGTVSVPLITDTLAFSVGEFKRRDAGFIDNPILGTTDVNSRDVKGGRIALLWKPSEDVSLKIGVLTQDTTANGTNSIDVSAQLQPTLGDLQQNRAPGTSSYESKVRFYDAVLNADLGRYHLTSLTGYGVNDFKTPRQFSSAFWSGLSQQYFNVSGNELLNQFRTEKFSEELRLSSPMGEKIEWLVGAFYTHEKSPASQTLLASDSVTGTVAGSLFVSSYPTTYEEYAAFGDLTVHFTDQFDVQFGARESENRQTYNESDFGVVAPTLFGSNPFVYAGQTTQANAFTYLVTPRFKVSSDLMMYARLASGYRAGGNNGEAPSLNLPPTFKPDKTLNYELGVKGALWDRLLTFDTSIYYIDWKDVQLFQQDPVTGLGFFTNGGKARSDGIELALHSNPLAGLTISITAAYTDAVLRQDLPIAAGVGYDGDRLPYSARFAASAILDDEFPLAARLTGFVGATVTYTGDRFGSFVNPVSTEPLVPGVRSEFPAYASADVRTGVRYGAWRVGLYVANVADKRGVLDAASRISGTALPTNLYGMTVTQPRTYGLSVSTSF
jgi:outer membrane receptor protein involved in Fe transport